ncbi:hypothetical protein HC766_02675 [Candidatus Gracilibacteria bacterium]|nr:hypothetical protein [Candidatus Gracilibacteria bacterium]
MIRKAGDIIPEVVDVLIKLRVHKHNKNANTDSSGKFKIPNKCPSCATQLIKTQTKIDLLCPNIDTCPAQIIGRLSYFSSRNLANIVGLSEKIIERFIDEYKVSDIPDLYNLPWDQIKELEGFGSKSVENLQKAIDNSKKISDVKS